MMRITLRAENMGVYNRKRKHKRFVIFTKTELTVGEFLLLLIFLKLKNKNKFLYKNCILEYDKF